MSGGGGGSYGGPTKSATDCDIVERVPLNSPKAAVLATLSVGVKLTVETANEGMSLVAKHGEQIAGSLTPRTLLDLLECIGKGNVYVAHVLQLKAGFCEVEIRRQ